MPELLLHTKLFIPPLRPVLVPRPALTTRLNLGIQQGHKLILVSAPAGFGKTTLVSQWIGQTKDEGRRTTDTLVDTGSQLIENRKSKIANRFTWFSLDEGDNDLTRFLTYFIAALNQALEEGTSFGERVMDFLHAPQSPPMETVLTALINEIALIPGKIVLVLDDYHLVEAEPVHEALSFLLDNMPPQIQLLIATREDPPLPLSRLRARGQLSELRAADLRFSPPEAAEFLNQVMGLGLAPEDVAALEMRTEGWIVGLQMAALSMQGRADTGRFIQAFTGSHRFVLDYLVEEVLQSQPHGRREFLLQTSFLDRLNGPLCDAITQQENSKVMLETLERGNLFVVPLDEQRQWYRYHHLFADVLQERLLEEQPDLLPTLHRRASEWYEVNGSMVNAVRHALAAGDFQRTADLAEMSWETMDNIFQLATWLDWAKAIPDKLIRNRPVLCTQYAWALIDCGEPDGVETRLEYAERWLGGTVDKKAKSEDSVDEVVIINKEQFQTLPGMIAVVRANKAQYQGDASGTVKYAEQALELIPEEDIILRAQAAAILGMTHWARGELEPARQAMTGWIDSMQKVGNIYFVIASSFALADILTAQGRLREALSTYQEALQLAPERDQPVQSIIAHHHLGLAMLFHEMGEQQAASHHLQKSSELGELSTLIDWPYRRSLAQARLSESRGALDAALSRLDEAQRQYIPNPVPNLRPTAALKAQVYLKKGDLVQAQQWAHDQGLTVGDELSYLREFEHLTLARLRIAEYEQDRADAVILEALGLLERLLEAAESSERVGSVIEILIVQALAHQAKSDIPAALASLERALVLAEPRGYFRIFIDEGPPMGRLLYEALTHEIAPAYVQRLLAAFEFMTNDERRRRDPSSSVPGPSSLVDPLSPREIEVLQLVADGLSNPQIAAKLYLALNTVKGHTRNIYSKLGVHNRVQAVARARALGILPPN